MSLAPSSTVPLPEPERPGRPRKRWRGALVAFLVGLAVPAGVVVADKTGEPLDSSSSGSDSDLLGTDRGAFLERGRLATSLAALATAAGTTRTAQLAFDSRQLSADLLDADTGLYVRLDEYESSSPGEPYRTDLVRQPPPEAVFDLAVVGADALLTAMETANRSLGNDDADLEFLHVLVERPFPTYGDPLIVVDDGYGVAPRRVWLSLDGTVLRVEGP